MTYPEDPPPRGIANNNPGNIRASTEFAWKGQVGVDEQGFCKFSAPVYGLRAIALLWANYHRYYGCDTIREYINRWAPPSQNPTSTYAAFVAAAAGVGVDDVIDIHAHALALVQAIVHFENGEQPYDTGLINHAIAMSHVQ